MDSRQPDPQVVLNDGRLKLARADGHIEELATAIRTAGLRPDFYAIRAEEKIGEDDVLLVYVGADTTRPEEWGPIIGDALYNLRSSLDTAWWQLARAHLEREPNENEARQIQFPILRRGSTFDGKRFAKWVGEAAARLAEEFQTPGEEHPAEIFGLEELRRLGNIDKHRTIHVAAYVTGLFEIGATWHGKGPEPVERMDFSLPEATFHPPRADRPWQHGDLVISIPLDSWIRDPDFDFDIYQKGYVSIDGRFDLLQQLTLIRNSVRDVLDSIELILQGQKVMIKYGAERVDQLPPDPPNSTRYTVPGEPGPVLPDWQNQESSIGPT